MDDRTKAAIFECDATDEDFANARLIALELIAHGHYQDKRRYIARFDPDYFVENVLDWQGDYTVDRPQEDNYPARRALIDIDLASAIARIALGPNYVDDPTDCWKTIGEFMDQTRAPVVTPVVTSAS